MEPSKEPISVRTNRLNSQLISNKIQHKSNLVSRDGLLDALTVLYDECNTECLKKFDQHISDFVCRQRTVLSEVKCLRVNIFDFELKKNIGRGHFGEVFVVREKQTSDFYAMKVLRKVDCLSHNNISYEEERNIMASATSNWLTKLQYSFLDTNNLYFIMEYLPGGDLSGLLSRQGGTVPESAALFYVAELVLALNDLHGMGYVHRDVKPENILLDRCGHLKLADFGSAAKINPNGRVQEGMPVGTPDYIAPEVLQCMDNKMKKCGYGMSCDYWSVGILGYQLTVGNTPFSENNTTETYAKIMNYSAHLKFPPDIVLSQAFISLVHGLVTDCNTRLNFEQVLKHPAFKNIDFDGLKDRVPPYVPKIESVDDTSNFNDIPSRKNEPNIENFKSKTQFSGRNLPFIGFTYTQDLSNYKINNSIGSDTSKKAEELQNELKQLQKKVIKCEVVVQEQDNLERKLGEQTRKVNSLENLRGDLERSLAGSISECGALKRTLELERKDRVALEHKALELIKAAKQKWETLEKNKVDSLNLEIAQQKEKIQQLTSTNTLLNEQLQHALQMQYKHRDSVETVEHLSRKSIIGLETRLEKVTLETQTRITDIQHKLTDETHQKKLLEKELEACKTTNENLNEKLKVCEENCGSLMIKLEGNQKLIRELENRIEILEESARTVEEHKKKTRLLEDELVKLKNDQIVSDLEEKLKTERVANGTLNKQVKELKEELNSLTASKNLVIEEQKRNYSIELQKVQDQLSKTVVEANQLEVKLQQAKTAEINNNLKVQSLEELLLRLESGLTKLEGDGDKENVLKQQIERLEQQLIQVHENLALEKRELSQLKTKFWRTEKDLSNAEIDKRIFKRELKEAEDNIKKLQEEIQILNGKMVENKRTFDNALLEFSTLNEDLAQEIVKMKEFMVQVEGKLQIEKEKGDGERNTVNKLRVELNGRDSLLTAKTKELEICRQAQKELLRKVETLETEKQESLRVMSDLENCRSELQNTQLNLKALREACTLLEDQVIKYEDIHVSYENRQRAFSVNTDKLIRELAQAKEHIQDTKKQVNEERSLRLMAETQCQRLIEDIECLKNEAGSYKQQCMDYRSYSMNLTEEVTSLEEKISDLEVTLKSYERQISNFMGENRMLKEENSEQLTNLNNVKDSNYQLGLELTNAKKTNNELIDSINELQDALTQNSNYQKERELKAGSTIQQQIKLIDFLQSKIEECKKKKTLSDKLFGHSKKENTPPTPVPVNYKDLENMLLQEREANKALQQEIDKLKSKTKNTSSLSPHTKIALEKLTEVPKVQKSDLYRQNSKHRMYHNIPHRFESKICTKSMKCAHCSNPISLGRNNKTCTECNIAVHPYCAQYLPKSCGVPQAYIKQFSDSLTKLNLDTKTITVEDGPIEVEGWVKTPVRGNTGWDRHYACLTLTTLKIYSHQPNSSSVSPIETFELQPPNSHGMVILEPVISELNTPVAVSDLPFVIKIQISPNTTCWPPKTLILMTLSLDDKEKWSKALTQIFQTHEKYEGDSIFTLPPEIQVNCLTDLNPDTKLIGTEQGLYSYHNDTLLHISGPLHVYQISILPKLNQCLMIADSNRYLISCNLTHLTALTKSAPCSKPTLIFKSVNVNDLNGFHLFEFGTVAGTTIVSLANSKQLTLMSYDKNIFEFVPIRILDTAEPTSCMLFTEHSLIVGANKYFEIDLSTFDVEEFLDLSDRNLCQVIMCYEVGSFPIGIVKTGSNPIEYLLCFNEFAVFVDEYGRHSRVTEIKWNRLPQAFYYNAPYLHIVQFASVEIIKITPETCNLLKNSVDSLLNVDCFTVPMKNVQYMGNSRKGVYVASAGVVKHLEAKKVDSDADSTDEESLKDDASSENCSEEFSFTSSMVNSLDGCSSDTESCQGRDGYFSKKRVTFETRTTNL